jgi:hypothetical protein
MENPPDDVSEVVDNLQVNLLLGVGRNWSSFATIVIMCRGVLATL